MKRWTLALFLWAAPLLCTALSIARAQDDPLTGVWGAHVEYQTAPNGTLTLQRDGKLWRASLDGAKGTFQSGAGELRFTFENGADLFRGHLRGAKLEGYWLRHAIAENTAGTAQGYAAPLAFTRISATAWRASITPLPDENFTLYLKISRDTGGKLVAAFRNPELNSHGPAMQLLVSQQGTALRFSTWPDQQPQSALDATLTADGIQLFWKDLNRNVLLKPLDAAQAAPFYARPPGSPPYAYRQPEETGDGWRTAPPSTLGMNEAALAHAVQTIIDIDPAGKRRAFQIHSLAVAYKGKLVLDEYFHGFTRDQPHDMRSASKTLASVMLGTAMLHGVKISPETKVYPLLAHLGPFANPDPRKSEITIADFITHTPGLDCDDNNDDDPHNEDHMQSQRAQPDWRKFTLDLSSVYAPGTRYAYCSGNINVVGGAISTATKTWLPEWFDETVARPLQFGPWYWNLMPNGEGYSGGGVYIRTRDFLKLGQTWLNGGVWNSRRIASAAWVKESVAPHRRISPETTGRHGDAFAEVYLDGYDGYAWHLSDIQSPGHTYHAYFANGNGGQLLIVVPELDLVCMFTAGNYAQGIWLYLRDAIVGKEIIPAIRG